MKILKTVWGKAVAFVAAAGLPAVSMASGGGIDYSPIVDAVNFGDMSTVVLSVAGALAGIYVIVRGVRIALGFVRS